jgi:hypothetical protein
MKKKERNRDRHGGLRNNCLVQYTNKWYNWWGRWSYPPLTKGQSTRDAHQTGYSHHERCRIKFHIITIKVCVCVCVCRVHLFLFSTGAGPQMRSGTTVGRRVKAYPDPPPAHWQSRWPFFFFFFSASNFPPLIFRRLLYIGNNPPPPHTRRHTRHQQFDIIFWFFWFTSFCGYIQRGRDSHGTEQLAMTPLLFLL